MAKTFDVVITGAGLSGLALAHRLTQKVPDLSLAIVDPEFDREPSKTWCFWGQAPQWVEPYVERTWTRMRVTDGSRTAEGQLRRNPYHLVRASTFTSGVIERLQACRNITWVKAPALSVQDGTELATVALPNGHLRAPWVFQSHRGRPTAAPLYQHFGGWEVETDADAFDSQTPTLMDFVPARPQAVGFYYVLPLTSRRALVEYTEISGRPGLRSYYDAAVRRYLDRHVSGSWRRVRREYGLLPMDARPVSARSGRRVFNLGRAAGMTKPSTGYTFLRTLNQVEHLADALLRNGEPTVLPQSSMRFRFYDRLFLQVLRERPQLGPDLFYRLFRFGGFDRVFDFLSESTSLWGELPLIASLPAAPFLNTLLSSPRRLPPRAATLRLRGMG